MDNRLFNHSVHPVYSIDKTKNFLTGRYVVEKYTSISARYDMMKMRRPELEVIWYCSKLSIYFLPRASYPIYSYTECIVPVLLVYGICVIRYTSFLCNTFRIVVNDLRI